jgi:hypothetical protein
VFLQNYQGRQIFRLNELFFNWKIGGTGPWCGGPSPRHQLTGSTGLHYTRIIHPVIYGLDLNKTKSYFCSNLDHPSKIRRLGTFLLPQLGPTEQSHRGAMSAGLRGPKLKLWCTICDEISSYAIYTTRGTHFAHLWWRKHTRESERRRRDLNDSWWRWLTPPMVLWWEEQDE